jgi:hypothetical protein
LHTAKAVGERESLSGPVVPPFSLRNNCGAWPFQPVGWRRFREADGTSNVTVISLIRTVCVGLLAILLIGVLLYLGYQHPWTGLPLHIQPSGEIVAAKTLWDWLDLLIVPLALAIIAFAFNASARSSERRIENDRQRQRILDSYIDAITDLLLNRNLSERVSNEARLIARTRTLTAARLLDGPRKAQLLQFLYEAGLIEKEPVVELRGADFDDARLDEATLSGSELRGVYFRRASFDHANLANADFAGSDFSHADLRNANMENANFSTARMRNAKLDGASLSNAQLDQVDATGVRRKTRESLRLGD